MGILKSEPPGPVGSADELLAVAYAMEREAGRRYRDLADRMRGQGESELATLFDFLGGIEDKHADQIDHRGLAIIGKRPDPARVRWELPEKFEDEEASSYLLTPYRALAIAVRNEERAFAFFSYIAAHAPDDRLREMAEHCAKDELDHASLLRRERRKAWRRERGSAARRPRPERERTLDEFLAEAAAMERAAAAGHRSLAATLTAAGDTDTARLFEVAARDEAKLAEEAEAGLGGTRASAYPATVPRTVRDGLRLLEYAFERYSDVAELTANEAVMAEAQVLAERALRRLTSVRGSLAGTLIEGS